MRYDQLSPVPPLTPVVKSIVISCVAMFIVRFAFSALGIQIFGQELDMIFGIVPSEILDTGWVWQFITYTFLHGSPFHLLLNMLILWYFGAEIELRMGPKRFTFFYFLCGVGAGLLNFCINAYFGVKLSHPIIGASGAIYGVLAAYAYFYADRYFLVFFVFPMKAKYFVMLIAAMELMFGVEARPEDNVAHFAHLGGIFFGLAFVYFNYIRTSAGSGRSRRDHEREKLKKQFTLIVNDSTGKKEEDDDRGPYWN